MVGQLVDLVENGSSNRCRWCHLGLRTAKISEMRVGAMQGSREGMYRVRGVDWYDGWIVSRVQGVR